MNFHETHLNPDTAPWKVTYGSSRAGKELSLNHTFRWCGRSWQIPAVYLCGKGLVVDLVAEVDPEQIARFRKKWNHTEKLCPEAQQQMDFEDPFIWNFDAAVSVNGKPLTLESGRSICWEPEELLAKDCENDPECAPMLVHYGLDPKKGWLINRFCYPWVTKRAPTVKTISAELARRRLWSPAVPVDVPAVGGSVTVTSPITGKAHTLHVTDCREETIQHTFTEETDAEFPTCRTCLTYTLTPDLPGIDVSLSDRDPDDAPRSSSGETGGIIGGEEAPALPRSAGNPHVAYSALRFAPAESIRWKIAFSRDPHQSVWVNLL